VGLSACDDKLTLSLPMAWLRRHPLTRLDLTQESDYLSAIPLKLTVSTR
jgi:hypothetical protein